MLENSKMFMECLLAVFSLWGEWIEDKSTFVGHIDGNEIKPFSCTRSNLGSGLFDSNTSGEYNMSHDQMQPSS